MDREALAQFLRHQRERLTPQDVGLQAGTRRRTPGLRREEVAQVAGMSVDYYVRLEQRRGPQPSPQMLGALARALRLTEDQRDYLYRLADHPAPPRYGSSNHVRPGMLTVLDQLTETPAIIVNYLGDHLAANALADALLGHSRVHLSQPGDYYRQWFTNDEARSVHPEEDHEYQDRIRVADLRAIYGKYAKDAVVCHLVAELERESPRFKALWDEHEVAVKHRTEKRIVHPTVGVIEVICETMISADTDQRLVLFTAEPGSTAADQLQLLKVVGRQEFVSLDD